MLGYLLLLFTLIPILELAILIKVGQYWGVWNTVAVVVLTGVSGALLAKSQGLIVLRKIQEELEEGIMPTDKLLDGFLILCGGIFLLTPGFLTDGVGFIILLPFTRNVIKLWLKRKIRRSLDEGRVITFTSFRF